MALPITPISSAAVRTDGSSSLWDSFPPPASQAPDFAGAAPGMVGMTLVKMKITDDIPSGTTVNFWVMVNTKQSATVILPLQ